MGPDLIVEKWLNIEGDFSYNAPRDRVILLYAFQMLCPACVLHSIPQANKIYQMFPAEKLQVIGLHSVFEHHAAMQEESLKAFIYEFKIKFPIAIDKPSQSGRTPQTMQRFSMQGTPSMLIFNQHGRLQLHRFGHIDDIEIGYLLGSLLSELG